MHAPVDAINTVCSMKVSNKQNTLMKWFSKSPKKEKGEGSSRDGAEEELAQESPECKKRKVEG